jgi:hypothetical protein
MVLTIHVPACGRPGIEATQGEIVADVHKTCAHWRESQIPSPSMRKSGLSLSD